MKLLSSVIAALCCLSMSCQASAVEKLKVRHKPLTVSQKLEAVADQQEKLMQAQEIQQRQLQEISHRLNSSNYRERVTPPAPYAYP